MNLNVSKAMADARRAMSEGAFQQAGGILSNAKNIVREEVQLKTKGEIKKIIEKKEIIKTRSVRDSLSRCALRTSNVESVAA